MTTYHLRTPDDQGKVLSVITQAPLDGKTTVAVNRTTEKDKLIGLYWHWLGEMAVSDYAANHSKTKDDFHEQFKRNSFAIQYWTDPQKAAQEACCAAREAVSELGLGKPKSEVKEASRRVLRILSSKIATKEQWVNAVNDVQDFCRVNHIPISKREDTRWAV